MANWIDEYLMSRAILTPDQLASIGAVACECTYLDQVVEVLIWNLAGMEFEQGKFFTANMQMDKKLDLLSDLGKRRLDEVHIPEFTKIISDCKTANNDRNTIIHGIWVSGEQDFLQLLRQGPENSKTANAIKRRLRSEALTFPADKINDVAKRLSHVRIELQAFSGKYKLLP